MDRPDSRPEPGDQELAEVSIDWQPDDDTRRPAWPMTVAMMAVVAVLGAGIAVASALGGSGDGPDHDEAADVVVDDDSGDSNDRTPLIDTIGPLGPRDGLDSKRHPVAVSPSDGLLDGQEVTVTGSEFPADTAVGVVMCSGVVDLGGGAAQCQLSPFTQATTDIEGNFEVVYPVRRIIQIGDQEIDCAAPTPEGLDATCVVAVGALDDYDESGIAPVHFDDSVPAPPPPEMTVSPTTDLVDGQIIEVTVTGIDDGLWWWPMLCTTGLDGEEWCEQPLRGPAGYEELYQVEGPGTVEVAVQRVLADFGGQAGIDCAEEVGRCWIMVWAGPRPVAPVALGFDPAGPIPEPRPHPTVVEPTDTTEPPGPTTVTSTSIATDTTLAPADP